MSRRQPVDGVPLHRGTVGAMEQIVVVMTDAQYEQVRGLFDAYRQAVEVFASAAEVCA